MARLSARRAAVTAVLFAGCIMAMLCGKLCFAALEVPFPSSDEFSAVSGHATTFAKMTGLLPCGSQLGVSIARPLQAPVLGSQKISEIYVVASTCRL